MPVGNLLSQCKSVASFICKFLWRISKEIWRRGLQPSSTFSTKKGQGRAYWSWIWISLWRESHCHHNPASSRDYLSSFTPLFNILWTSSINSTRLGVSYIFLLHVNQQSSLEIAINFPNRTTKQTTELGGYGILLTIPFLILHSKHLFCFPSSFALDKLCLSFSSLLQNGNIYNNISSHYKTI